MRTFFLAAMLVTAAASPSSADLMDISKSLSVEKFQDCMLKYARNLLHYTNRDADIVYIAILPACQREIRIVAKDVQDTVSRHIWSGAMDEMGRSMLVGFQHRMIRETIIQSMVLERGLLRQTEAPSFLHDFNQTF